MGAGLEPFGQTVSTYNTLEVTVESLYDIVDELHYAQFVLETTQW